MCEMTDLTTEPMQKPPRFPATWISHRYPVAYRLMPKCACSTLGQWIHYLDHSRFYNGLVHDRDAPILKWGIAECRPTIVDRLTPGGYLFFAIVRNPYRRLASAFADKIFGYQANGIYYRGGELHQLLETYGYRFGPESNVIDNFKIFVRFVADTLEGLASIPADPHWRPCATMLRINARLNPDWLPTYIGHVESLTQDLAAIADLAGIPAAARPASLPRDNTTSLGQITVEQLFGEEEKAIVQRVYAEDFRWFGYGPEPDRPLPAGPVDVATVRGALQEEPAKRLEPDEPEVAS